MLTRLFLALMWLLHWLPLPLLARLGEAMGLLLYLLVPERRRVTLTNLGLCFPDLGPAQRSALARRHFRAFGRSFLERAILWWASPERLRHLVRITGQDHLDALSGTPVILLAPHFVGLDMGWSRLCLDRRMASMYSNQKNPEFNAALLAGRRRFNDPVLVSRQEGTRALLRALRQGLPLYYLPDMDYGPRDSIFVGFFGQPAATITALSRLARVSGAVVVPVVTTMDRRGYWVDIGEPWPGFPGESEESDTRRMNAFIESCISPRVEQYLWMHKRFKTRPPGEKAVY